MPDTTYTFTNYLAKLKDTFGGRPLPIDLSDYLAMNLYPKLLPHNFKKEGEPERPIYTHMGLKIATGYSAIAFTDYGPYLEVTKEQILRHTMQQSSGTTSDADSNVSSYVMYRSNDGMTNVRYQIREILGRAFSTDRNIRHFRRNKFYISVYEVADGTLLTPEEGDLLPVKNSLICQPANCFGTYRDGITDISLTFPDVKEEYTSLCAAHDPLSLLGNYQVIQTGEGSDIQGVVNLFCDMTNVVGRRRSVGMNYDSMVNCIYDLCCDYPDYTVIIPYYIGCSTNAEWASVLLKLSCRLKGKNVKLVKPKRITQVEPEQEPQTISTEPAKELPNDQVEAPQESTNPVTEAQEIESISARQAEPKHFAPSKRPNLYEILERCDVEKKNALLAAVLELEKLETFKIMALIEFLR